MMNTLNKRAECAITCASPTTHRAAFRAYWHERDCTQSLITFKNITNTVRNVDFTLKYVMIIILVKRKWTESFKVK